MSTVSKVAGGGGGGNNSTSYLKVYITFQCCDWTCNHRWGSPHCWTEDKEMPDKCEACGETAKLLEIYDDEAIFDSYSCPTTDCPGLWQWPHHGKGGKGVKQQCKRCLKMVAPSKTPQLRFAKMHVFQCKNDICPNIEKPIWEDVSTGRFVFQKCRCGSKGMLVSVCKSKELTEEEEAEMKRRKWLAYEKVRKLGIEMEKSTRSVTLEKEYRAAVAKEKSMHHDEESCGMCKELKEQEFPSSCLQYQKIVMQLEASGNGDGATREKIIETIRDKGMNYYYKLLPSAFR